MNVKIVLPLPLDNWSTFDPFIHRFIDTFKEHQPGHSYLLIAVGNNATVPDDVRSWFDGINTRFIRYDGQGYNLGSAQAALSVCFDHDFMICMSSRCYFHKPNWLFHYVSARREFGPGLYGVGSFEQKRHIRLCAFGIDANIFRCNPNQVTTPDEGHRLEVQDWCLTDFVEDIGGSVIQASFAGAHEEKDWRTPDNIFRRGDQSNLLVFDKWSDHYREVDAAFKAELETRTNPPANAIP